MYLIFYMLLVDYKLYKFLKLMEKIAMLVCKITNIQCMDFLCLKLFSNLTKNRKTITKNSVLRCLLFVISNYYGGHARTRTWDQLCIRQPLYQLSYMPIPAALLLVYSVASTPYFFKFAITSTISPVK